MHKRKFEAGSKLMLIAGILAGGIAVSRLDAQSSAPPSGQTAKTTLAPSHYRPSRFPKRAGEYYRLVWGVDSLSVKAVESGELIRFNYRVVDADKAKQLNNKNINAFLNCPEHHVQLVIPSLEKVGKLRQINTPEPGKSYWMAFSNPRRSVKRGDRVDLVIGEFHADGLIVE
jgi:hypothetical protein